MVSGSGSGSCVTLWPLLQGLGFAIHSGGAFAAETSSYYGERLRYADRPREMQVVQQISLKQQSLYHYVHTELVLNVSFQNFMDCDLTGLDFHYACDVGMGFRKAEPPLRSLGWFCDNQSFDHAIDSFREGGGVYFDSEAGCNGVVSWEAELPHSGLYFVDVYMKIYSKLLTNGEACFLNGESLNAASGTLKPVHGRADSELLWMGLYQVLVVDRRLRFSGRSMACGALMHVVAFKVKPPVGNIDCWNFNGFEYHLCCTTYSGVRPDFCFGDGAFSFARCCRSTKRSAGIHVGLPSVPAPARPCLSSYCQRECVGAPASFYDLAPAWLKEVPRPSPLVCEGIPIYPLTYSIPRELVAECIPPKSTDFALSWPADVTTYLFDDSESPIVSFFEYFRMYRESLFAVTARKSGDDAARHTEILASGSIPLMPDIWLVSKHSMAHHHKGLLKAAWDLPGVRLGVLNQNHFNVSSYLSLAQKLLQWTRHRLTTLAIAEYFLDVLEISQFDQRTQREAVAALNSIPPMERPSMIPRIRLLFLVPEKIETMPISSFMLLHGLREALGAESVVDYPLRSEVYEQPGRPTGQVSGGERSHRFFTARWRLPRVLLDRSTNAIKTQLEAGFFSHVVYSFLQPSYLDDVIVKHVPESKLVGVKGFDHMSTQLMPWARRMGVMFGFNLDETCPS